MPPTALPPLVYPVPGLHLRVASHATGGGSTRRWVFGWRRLLSLLRAAAAYAAGGRKALEALARDDSQARPLLEQMRGG